MLINHSIYQNSQEPTELVIPHKSGKSRTKLRSFIPRNSKYDMKLKIGCTGWSYDGWSGTFYPKKLPKSDWLHYYSRIFPITEINSTL